MQIGLGLWLGTRQVGDGSSLNLNFLSGSLDSRIDFTRTTSATFVGSNGLIQNTPASVNLLTFTQEFDNAAWLKTATTVGANSTAAPDGTMTADTMTANAGTAINPRIFPLGVSATVSATTYTTSFFVKPGTHTFVQLFISSQTTDWCNFTLSGSGTVQNNGAAVGAITFDSATGYYRISMTYVAGGTNRHPGLSLVPSGTATQIQTWNPVGTETVFLWGAQLEQVPDANLVLGSELVTNGDFSGGLTGWTSGGAIASSLVSGEAQITFAGSAALSAANWFSQADVLTDASKVYRVAFDATWVSGGVLQVSSGFDIQRTITAVGTNKTGYVTYVRRGTTGSVANQQTLVFAGAAGAVWKIDNVTVKEITGTVGMPSDYTRNVGGLFPARFDYDPVSLAPRGLLIEEQRTNLLTYSEQFDNAVWTKANTTVTANATVSPSGATVAEKLVSQASTATMTLETPAVAVTSGASYVWSVFLKASEYTFAQLRFNLGAFSGAEYATFNLSTGTITQSSGSGHSITPVGNGWYRCVVVGTATSTTNANPTINLATSGTGGRNPSITGDGTSGIFVWGAQVEAGAFATSYIPTVASQVTRTADQATIVAPMFAPWYNQTEGSWVAEWMPYVVTGTVVAQISAATNNDRFQLLNDNGSQIAVTTAGVGQGGIDAGTVLPNAINKLAYGYRTNDTAASLAGGVALPDNTVTLPVVDRLTIGATVAAAGHLNGHIRRITYYPVRLLDTQLQALTA